MTVCSICGGTTFTERAILWDKLVAEWQLAPHERAYIDRQQGTTCTACGANLRSIALADAVRAVFGTALTLRAFAETAEAKGLSVLEINEAGNLTPVLRQFPGHVPASYPAVDMLAMPYADASFDLVIHSDTLEHIVNPIQALVECRRVLRPGGALCFTVPTVVGRLSRGREGLPKSYHGSVETGADDYAVQTEFGADMWTYVLRAGFSALSINTVDFPAALALSARKDGSSIHNRVTGLRGRPSQERIVSLHFPKAAGSSLRLQLEALLGAELALDYDHDPLTSKGGETAEFPNGKRLIHGHFRAQRYTTTTAYWMTFLRHPVDNLMSIYFFWKNMSQPGHRLHAQFLRESPSILEFANYPAITNLMSETYFGGFDMRRFDFIGLHENRGVDIPRLAAELGLPLMADVHENRTVQATERREIEEDRSIRRRLTDILAADIRFYDQMRR